jgi:hypothetical protein
MSRKTKPAPITVDTRTWQERWLEVGERLRKGNERFFDEMLCSDRVRLDVRTPKIDPVQAWKPAEVAEGVN